MILEDKNYVLYEREENKKRDQIYIWERGGVVLSEKVTGKRKPKEEQELACEGQGEISAQGTACAETLKLERAQHNVCGP